MNEKQGNTTYKTLVSNETNSVKGARTRDLTWGEDFHNDDDENDKDDETDMPLRFLPRGAKLKSQGFFRSSILA